MSLDSAYDNKATKKQIFNAKMKPNIKENPRGRENKKPGRRKNLSDDIYQERFYTVERAFSYEDKFKRLLMRFERKSINHISFKLLAYTMINFRHFAVT